MTREEFNSLNIYDEIIINDITHRSFHGEPDYSGENAKIAEFKKN